MITDNRGNDVLLFSFWVHYEEALMYTSTQSEAYRISNGIDMALRTLTSQHELRTS